MKLHATRLDGLWEIESSPYRDERGEFRRVFCAQAFESIRPELRFDDRTQAVATALLEQPTTNAATSPIQALLLQAGVEMLQPWAAKLHGRAVAPLTRPAIRFGASATAGVLRWALAKRAA